MIAVLGAGAWGTALAEVLAGKGLATTLWFFDQESLLESGKTGVNPFLPGLELNPRIALTGNISQAVREADWIVLVVPAQHFRETLRRAAPYLPPKANLIVCSKGIEMKGFKLMSEILAEELPYFASRAVYLSGPSFADEVAAGRETAVVVAGPARLAKAAQELFACRYFRPYVSNDIIGVQVAGAYKNALAIAAGILAGLGKGHNLKAALIARGLKEMTLFGMALGAKRETFSGLAGVGDLLLTAGSSKSRNYSLGLAIGQGQKAKDCIASQKAVVEGYYTVKAIFGKAKELGLEPSITGQLYKILYQGKDPEQAISALMRRELKQENW